MIGGLCQLLWVSHAPDEPARAVAYFLCHSRTDGRNERRFEPLGGQEPFAGEEPEEKKRGSKGRDCWHMKGDVDRNSRVVGHFGRTESWLRRLRTGTRQLHIHSNQKNGDPETYATGLTWTQPSFNIWEILPPDISGLLFPAHIWHTKADVRTRICPDFWLNTTDRGKSVDDSQEDVPPQPVSQGRERPPLPGFAGKRFSSPLGSPGRCLLHRFAGLWPWCSFG